MKGNIRKIAKKIRINDKTINFLLIFILGFLVGVAVKTEARNRITIGYGDYLAGGMRQDFDLMKKEKEAFPEGGAGQNPETPPAESQDSVQIQP